jgi:hypothetical protein
MDIGESNFWQNLVLGVLLVPYVIGIGIGTYQANKQRRLEKGKPRPPAPAKGK